ncbi:hypothetical protein PJE062_3283 [Pseudovibrio sp. JE062]|nr:hypothetical protein PJE062_3283 [Pseudovibrio sp. JE062]
MTVVGFGLPPPSDVILEERSGDPGSRAARSSFDDRADEVAAKEYRRKSG